jgi:hypothetical protein
MTPGTVRARWMEHVRRRYGWIIFLSQTAFVWGVLGIVLLVLFGIRRRRDRERMERLRERGHRREGEQLVVALLLTLLGRAPECRSHPALPGLGPEAPLTPCPATDSVSP